MQEIFLKKASNIDLGDIRMSAGFGFAYLSPIGPIGAFISTPILKKDGDDIEEFRIFIRNWLLKHYEGFSNTVFLFAELFD
jgi:outer membrane protein assembly factor BamA